MLNNTTARAWAETETETETGLRFSKDRKTLRARKAIRKTPTRLLFKADLFICCKENKN